MRTPSSYEKEIEELQAYVGALEILVHEATTLLLAAKAQKVITPDFSKKIVEWNAQAEEVMSQGRNEPEDQ
jgi:2-keto-3-deoxy-6-phosphogluconate aldolase